MDRHRWKWGLSNWTKWTPSKCAALDGGYESDSTAGAQYLTKSIYVSSLLQCCSQGHLQQQGCRPTFLGVLASLRGLASESWSTGKRLILHREMLPRRAISETQFPDFCKNPMKGLLEIVDITITMGNPTENWLK